MLACGLVIGFIFGLFVGLNSDPYEGKAKKGLPIANYSPRDLEKYKSLPPADFEIDVIPLKSSGYERPTFKRTPPGKIIDKE